MIALTTLSHSRGGFSFNAENSNKESKVTNLLGHLQSSKVSQGDLRVLIVSCLKILVVRPVRNVVSRCVCKKPTSHTTNEWHVKCDGARPNCLQCQKSNRICFALMRSETKFAFVIERFISEGAIIPPRQGKKHVERRHTAGRDQFRIPKSPLLRNNLKNWIPQSLTTSLEDQAMSYYFQRHVMSTFDIVDAAQDHSLYLYLMWMQSQRDSSFCLAVLATAYCAFGKARKNDAASKASRIMYFQAISTIKKSLTNSSESCSNQTLLGTLVLSFYEVR